MQITIDTKKDSHDDIKKVIQMLSHLIGGSIHINVPTETTPEPDTSNLMGMFSDPQPSPSEPQEEATPPDFSGFMNLVNKSEGKEEDPDEPKLQFF